MVSIWELKFYGFVQATIALGSWEAKFLRIFIVVARDWAQNCNKNCPVMLNWGLKSFTKPAIIHISVLCAK